MDWRLKLGLQKACSLLPFAREECYYQLQRRFGSLKHPLDPTEMFRAGVQVAEAAQRAGCSVQGARVLEVGTGRRLNLPIALFLCGAESIITVDLHRYLQSELALQAVDFIRAHPEPVFELFAPVTDQAQLRTRMDRLLSVRTAEELIQAAQIRYLAPADAGSTGLPAHSVDLHVSYTVFEHIPRDVLAAILREASRLLSPTGIAYHQIDLGDHLAYEDARISQVHFLRFSGATWDFWGGNQFAYHNRLREPDYRALYSECRHEVLEWLPFIDSRSVAELKAGLPLAPDFRELPPEVLATVVIRVTSRPVDPTNFR